MPAIKGSHNAGKAKMTAKEVIAAYCLMHEDKWTCGMVARLFNRPRTTMAGIRCGQSWAWLTLHGRKT